jgi:hypothetical protein
MDGPREFPWELAPGLTPIFGECHDGDDPSFWEALIEFDRSIEPGKRRDAVANDIMCCCFLYLALHELAHIGARHDRLAMLAREGDPRIPGSFGMASLRRGMEVQADLLAWGNFFRLCLMNRRTGRMLWRPTDYFFRVSSFAATMLFAMYDIHRKSVYEYDDGSYPHPLIRYEFSFDVMQMVLDEMQSRRRERAKRYSMEGWEECITALNALETDCFLGHYGRPSPEDEGGTGRYIPVTPMKYGAASALRGRVIADWELAERIARLTADLAAEPGAGP